MGGKDVMLGDLKTKTLFNKYRFENDGKIKRWSGFFEVVRFLPFIITVLQDM